jgi:hypothetical protein
MQLTTQATVHPLRIRWQHYFLYQEKKGNQYNSNLFNMALTERSVSVFVY